jgi:predicted signal transduction protein with EAL and GGDEF domain
MWPLPLRVAVNISARQLRDRGFVSMVVNALATSGLPATRLELEITESVLLQDNEETRSTLLQLKALGIAIAMDDFGTGYSSLSCLRSFPFDKIKIDQSFVRVMNDSLEASSIVSAIIELASNLNISTTAEGHRGRGDDGRVATQGLPRRAGLLHRAPGFGRGGDPAAQRCRLPADHVLKAPPRLSRAGTERFSNGRTRALPSVFPADSHLARFQQPAPAALTMSKL